MLIKIQVTAKVAALCLEGLPLGRAFNYAHECISPFGLDYANWSLVSA
jgi:hypothetical protein